MTAIDDELEHVRHQLLATNDRIRKSLLTQIELLNDTNALDPSRARADIQRKLDTEKREQQVLMADPTRLSEREKHLVDLVHEAELRFRDRESEDEYFWFRRIHTSLAIANGGAFAAVGAHLFDAATDAKTTALAWHPMAAFALGMIIAGLIPVALYLKRQAVAWWLAGGSAVLFAAGLAAALWAMWRKAGLGGPGVG